MFVAIEVNLLLWLTVLGSAMVKRESSLWSESAVVDGRLLLLGFASAAIVQHWAYYRLYWRRSEKATRSG